MTKSRSLELAIMLMRAERTGCGVTVHNWQAGFGGGGGGHSGPYADDSDYNLEKCFKRAEKIHRWLNV